jgi:hypothetical protein
VPFSVLPSPGAAALVEPPALPPSSSWSPSLSWSSPSPPPSPVPVAAELVDSSTLPEPVPAALVARSLWPEPAPPRRIEPATLPVPTPEELVARSLLPEPVVPAWVPRVPDAQPEASPAAMPVGAPVDLRRLAAESSPLLPPQPSPTPTRPTRPSQPERAAPTGPRRFIVGLVAVVLGASGVVAVRALVRSGDDDDLVASSPSVVTQAVIPDPGAVTPVTSEPSLSETTVVVPATSTVPDSMPPTDVAPPPPPTATRFTGVGNDVVDVSGYDLTSKIMVVSHSGVASFELATLGQDLNHLALVESVVGAVSGTYPIGLAGDPPPSYLRVDADGEWLIEIKPIEDARVWPSDSIIGTGADVLRYEGGAAVLDYTNAGASNFIVRYQRDAGYELLVNEIGPISGATTMQAGPGIVIVDTEGEWALSATPT